MKKQNFLIKVMIITSYFELGAVYQAYSKFIIFIKQTETNDCSHRKINIAVINMTKQ